MSISTLLQSVSSLQDLLEASIRSGDESSILAALQVVRDHSAYAGAGLLTAFGAMVAARALKRATQFRSLDGPASKSFLWGHEPLMFEFATSLEIHDQLLTNYGAVCKVKGALGEDRLWIADPRAMTEIVLKAYDDFREPEAFLSWIRLTMGPNILVTNGHKHKLQRKILNPVFTASHMRLLVTFELIVAYTPWLTAAPLQTPTITTIAYHLEDIIASKARANGSNTGVVDVFIWMSNVALEIIGQAGMGYSFGVMEEKEPEYLDASRQLFPLIGSMWYFRPFLPYLMKAGSAYFRRFMVEHLPIAPVQAMKKVTDTMDGTAAEIYRRKKEALEKGTLESEIAAGNDIMSALLKQNQVVAPEEQMTEEEIISQVSGLVFAGHDTTSGGLARTLHLLAQNPEVQTRLREEVQEAHRLYGKDLDYDQINSLNYLDAVCRESLRLHSPAQLVERVAQKDWDLPLQYPIKSKDGKNMISNIHVKKGTHIYLSLGSTNRDKQTWGDDADQFKPERWIQPLPSGVTEAKIPGLYSSTMTFLGGPRACLGFKFSQLEMKLVLSILVSSFMFELSDAEISWHADGVVKPHVRHKDGTIEQDASLPLKVTVVDSSS